MSKISDKKRIRIKEDIIAFLFEVSPQPMYTSKIAEELCRDEEFIKQLLYELYKEKLVMKISKNTKGKPFLARRKWQLSKSTYNAYKELI